jgi:hypothetical protein
MNKQYDIESLIRANPSFHLEHLVTEHDVEKVNNHIKLIENTRSDTLPKAGDKILFTSKHGDYCPNTIIEKVGEDEIYVCTGPTSPFIMPSDDGIYCSISGGPFETIQKKLLKYIGKQTAFFWLWGNCGACGNGGIYFEAEVSLWEYKAPDALYGEFTTKDWRKLYISKRTKQQMAGEIYLYTTNQGIAFRDEKEFKQFVTEHNGTIFPGHWPNSLVLWCNK